MRFRAAGTSTISVRCRTYRIEEQGMSKIETPVSGGGAHKGEADGVSGTPGGPEGVVQGRRGGSESAGGAYPNPQTGKTPSNSGFMGHGGQTEIGYHGGGQAGEGGDAPNAATGTKTSNGSESGAAAAPSAEHPARMVTHGGRTFAVVETDGIAEAEATGKVGTDASYEREQESPGSG
jgi:hypothetical protein